MARTRSVYHELLPSARRRVATASLCSTGSLILTALVIAPPASAQVLPGMPTSPFAGRMGQNGLQMSPLYGSQTGALPHILQGTTPTMLGGDSTFALNGMQMAATSEKSGGSQPGGGGEKTEAPEIDVGERPWDVLVGACAGGAFIGAFSAVSATVPTGAAPIAAPVVAYAGAIGCGVGVATAVVSLGAVYVWRRATR